MKQSQKLRNDVYLSWYWIIDRNAFLRQTPEVERTLQLVSGGVTLDSEGYDVISGWRILLKQYLPRLSKYVSTLKPHGQSNKHHRRFRSDSVTTNM